jgi:transcription initiation factor TFIIIB Brf1 subunit/transcription initiation factor TFIIB
MNNCKHCGSQELVIDNAQGDLICKNCGVVNAQHNMRHNVYNITYNVSYPENHTYKYKLNSFEENRSDKIFQVISNLISRLGINNDTLIDRSMQIFNILLKTKIPKIKKDELIASACVFIALRKSNIPYSYNELSILCDNVTKRELGRCCKRCYFFLQKEEKKQENWGDNSEKEKSILDNIPRYATRLGFTNVEIIYLKKISRHVEKLGLIRGCNPLSITAAVMIYVANLLNLQIKTNEVANVIGIAENTVQKSLKFLVKSKQSVIISNNIMKKLEAFKQKRVLSKK